MLKLTKLIFQLCCKSPVTFIGRDIWNTLTRVHLNFYFTLGNITISSFNYPQFENYKRNYLVSRGGGGENASEFFF